MEPAIFEIAIPTASKDSASSFPAHRLTCYEWGNKSAPHTLLCNHGLTRNGRDFDFIAQAVSNNFRVLCPDMPGRGKSEWLAAEHYNYETYLADIQYLLTHRELNHVHWLGTSMGGILAMMMANRKPGIIRSLILNDVGCHIPAEGLCHILNYAGKNMEPSTRNEAENHIRSRCASFGIAAENHWQHLFKHSLINTKNDAVRMHYDPAIITPLQSTKMEDIDLWPLFEAIKTIPTLLIRGEDSDILTEKTAHAMAQNHPNLERYNIADTGHAPALMAEDQINAVKGWLEKRI